MEARLAKHKATPNPLGNHFTRQDMASRKRIGSDVPSYAEELAKARVERQLDAMLTNARAAGRAMARYAQFLKRSQKDYIRDRDIIELLTTPDSVWMRQVWRKEAVHPELVVVAHNYMVKVLREKGWML